MPKGAVKPKEKFVCGSCKVANAVTVGSDTATCVMCGTKHAAIEVDGAVKYLPLAYQKNTSTMSVNIE